MPALTSRDAERLLRFVAEAESLGGDQPFSADLLVELGHLVSADWVTYRELDRVRRRMLMNVNRPDDEDDDEDELGDEGSWNLNLEQPICLRHQQGYFEALKLSDFITQRELHRTQLYDRGLRPWGIEYELDVAIPSPPWHTKTFMFDRRGTRDFTERDRLVLNLLQPHFARLWHAARTRRLLNAALASLDQESERDSRGVILLVGAEVEFASAPARRLLHEFFPGVVPDRIPAALEDWLESGATSLLISRHGGRQLSINRADDALLLEERHEDVHLTAREREVLAWVARGKTNAEIARLLWVAPGTVRKHLENVYAKLDVNTRTAAVARFFGLLDAEADAS